MSSRRHHDHGNETSAPHVHGLLDRRELLRRSLLCAAAGLGPSLVPERLFSLAHAQGTNVDRRFVLYVHLTGGWEGWASGLLQPHAFSNGKWIYPTAAFVGGASADDPAFNRAANELLNRHEVNGPFVWHGYSKVLARVQNNICLALGAAGSLGHPDQSLIVRSGSALPGGSGNPSWVAGFAQATAGTGRSRVSLSANFPAQVGRTGLAVDTLGASTIDHFVSNFRDSTSIPNPADGSYTNYAILQKNLSSALGLSNEEVQGLGGAIEALVAGLPPAFQRGNTAFPTGPETFLTDDRIRSLVTSEYTYSGNDFGAAAVSAAYFNSDGTLKSRSLLDQLRLAAFLIETGGARGLELQTADGDYHFGGAASRTSVAAASLWCHLVAFWDWVKSKGWEDKVLVIVAGDFARGAYKTTAGNFTTVAYTDEANKARYGASAGAVMDPGTDHALKMPMLFLGGRVPSGRIGGLLDGSTPAGGTDLRGAPGSALPAYSALRLVGSMMMRYAPSEFADARAVRAIWSGFSDEAPIPLVTGR